MIGLIYKKKVKDATEALDSLKGSAKLTSIPSVASTSTSVKQGRKGSINEKDKNIDKIEKLEKQLKIKDDELAATKKDMENLRSSVETSKFLYLLLFST